MNGEIGVIWSYRYDLNPHPHPHPRIRIDVILRSYFFFCLSKWLGRVWPPYFKKTMQRNWKFSFKFVLYMHKLNSTRHNMFFLRYTGYESGWLIKILDCPSDEWCLSHRTQTTGLPQGHIGCVHLECVCNSNKKRLYKLHNLVFCSSRHEFLT